MPKVCITPEQYRKARVSERMTDMYNLIRKARHSAHISEKECADVLGISQSGYSKAIERQTLNTWQLMMIMDFLDITWSANEKKQQTIIR